MTSTPEGVDALKARIQELEKECDEWRYRWRQAEHWAALSAAQKDDAIRMACR